MRRVFLSLALGLAASCAQAQTAPSPADVGISKGSPDLFKLKGHDNAWTPFGSVDPSTHVFVPGTNGNIAPNDCVKWGPGLTSAGAACNSVTGGAHPANQLTIYTNHAGLVANVTTPTEAWTVTQQGFYAPGDGGDASYNWNLTSYCAGGTSGAPVAADGIVCVLPIGQSASVAGRYLLSFNGSLDVRQIGMQPGGQDNSPYVKTLMNVVSQPAWGASGPDIIIPPILGQVYTNYYFSDPFEVYRALNLHCTGAVANSAFGGKVQLVFPPGVHGVVLDNQFLSPDGGMGSASDISGCSIVSLGKFGNGGAGSATTGNNYFDNVGDAGVQGALSFPMPTIGVGDGILAISGWQPLKGAPLVAPGAYVASVSAGTSSGKKVTMASPYVIGPYLIYEGAAIWDFPASEAYQIQTTAGNCSGVQNPTCPAANVIITGGKRLLKPGDFIWSDAFVFGSDIFSVNNTLKGTPTVNSGGSGYVGATGTMSWSGGGCYATPPVLNVTASGGVITAVTGVAAGGSCDGELPSSTGTNWVPGGGLSGGSGASFNMTFENRATIATLGGYYNPSPASVTHPAGSPGKMWVIPAGIMRRVESATHGNAITYFPFGLEMFCDSGATPATGCTASLDQSDVFYANGIGRFAMGNNTGASNSIANIHAYNNIVDIAEAGTVGSLYLGDNGNSAEDGSATWGAVGFCGSQDYSTFIGMYLSANTSSVGFCIDNDVNGNPNIGVGATHQQSHMLAIMTGLPDQPAIGGGQIVGKWVFGGDESVTATATAATSSGAIIALIPPAGDIIRGYIITDTTRPVIPDGTLVTDFTASTVTISNPLTGGGVQIGDKIAIINQYSSIGTCLGVSAGMNFSLSIDFQCGNRGWVFTIDGFRNALSVGWLNTSGLLFGAGPAYQGYQGGTNVIFPGGLEISNYQGGLYQEIRLDAGQEPPADAETDIRGNVRLIEQASPGGPMAWVQTAVATTTLSAVVVSGTTTSVAVAACPTIAPPVGTFITDTVRNPATYLGSFASCSGGTLTFQSPASHNGAINDPINFLGVRPAGIIARDAAGTTYQIGAMVNPSIMPPCDAGHIGFTTIQFAQLIGTAGYGTPVGTTLGPSTSIRPGFCDGVAWTYH